MEVRLGVDIGGTFTDVVLESPKGLTSIKVLTTYAAPENAIIEGMNRVLGTVTLMDPRGKLHLLGDVEPGKMEGVTLGQTVVVVYTEALALSLEHNQAE